MKTSWLPLVAGLVLTMLAAVGCLKPPPPASQPTTAKRPDGSWGADPDAQAASMQLVRRMGLGWNLGNTFDSCGSSPASPVDETSWGNPRVTEELVLWLKRDGIRSIRIPVTWRHHLGPAPKYAVHRSWMNRVEQVVDCVVGNGMYAIINLHHDGGGDSEGGAWIRNAGSDYAHTIAKYHAIWSQIAKRFRDYPHRLVFESMNEVGFDDLPKPEAYALLNRMNQAFVDQIRASGGNNATRHLLIAGYFTDIRKSAEGIAMPTDPTERCILSVHYYTPWQFCITGERQTWGTPTDLRELAADFDLLKATFVDRGVPVILGEYGVSHSTEVASRVRWLEQVTKTAHDMGVAPFFWDNGGEVDRLTGEWRTPGLLEALKRATRGADRPTPNARPVPPR
jgi:endoglucanase